MGKGQEDVKAKIMEKLPELLPKVVKSAVVHIIMLFYHISMPPWVTAIRIKRSLRSQNAENPEPEMRRRRRRRMRRRTFE